jgi:hypothetical protein
MAWFGCKLGLEKIKILCFHKISEIELMDGEMVSVLVEDQSKRRHRIDTSDSLKSSMEGRW